MRFVVIVVILLKVTLLAGQQAEVDWTGVLNSPLDEQNPLLSADGKTLFLTIAHHPQNVGGKKDPGDIWISRFNGAGWSSPTHGGTVLNNRSYNAVAAVSNNGQQVVLHGHYDPTGATARTQGIAISSWTNSGWSQPSNVSIPYFHNRSNLITGALSPDGNHFVFSADSYGTFGVEDLYVSVKENGRWSEPKNLGGMINTALQELSPALSADGKTLYFSSNGRKGFGSFDVYSATRMDEGWTNWSEPVNIGDRVNSSGRELYFRPFDQGFALYTSTTNSDGYGDVKLWSPETPFPKRDTLVVATDQTIKLVAPVSTTVVEKTPAADSVVITPVRPVKPVVNLYGKVLSASGETIEAKIRFIFDSKLLNEAKSTEVGYSINLEPRRDYQVIIEAPGFVSVLETLNLAGFAMKSLEMNYQLQPVSVGTTVNLKHVLFAQAKTDILPESFPELDVVVSFLQTNPRVKIELAGHTDNRGVHEDNIRLSQQRVNKVKEYLVTKGIDAKRITGKGYGGMKPIASNETEELRKLNRRVEFTIRKN